jgi:hypothetical protein
MEEKDGERRCSGSWGEFLEAKLRALTPEPGRDALPRVRADRQVGPTGFMECGNLELEAWSFSGAWCLGFGVFLKRTTSLRERILSGNKFFLGKTPARA